MLGFFDKEHHKVWPQKQPGLIAISLFNTDGFLGPTISEVPEETHLWIRDVRLKRGLNIRPGVISKMDLSTLQYFTFALKSKANTKMLH